jgi:hypothetical protein
MEVVAASAASVLSGVTMQQKMVTSQLFNKFKLYRDARLKDAKAAAAAAVAATGLPGATPAAVAAATVLRQQLGSRAYHSKHGIGRKQFFESLGGTKKASAGDCVCGTCLEHGHKNSQDAEDRCQ